MTNDPSQSDPPKDKGDLARLFHHMSDTLLNGPIGLSKIAAASRRAEKLGDYGRIVYAYEQR